MQYRKTFIRKGIGIGHPYIRAVYSDTCWKLSIQLCVFGNPRFKNRISDALGLARLLEINDSLICTNSCANRSLTLWVPRRYKKEQPLYLLFEFYRSSNKTWVLTIIQSCSISPIIIFSNSIKYYTNSSPF